MNVNFSVDPMYLTVFCIVKWIEDYYKMIDEKYSSMVTFIPSQEIDEDITIFGDCENIINMLEHIKYRDIDEMRLKLEIPNNRAKRFADFEYLSKYNLYLEQYDSAFAEKLIYIYAEKHNLDCVDFDDHERIGKTIWEYIHSTQEWHDLYVHYLSVGFGDTGMGVYSESLKHFIPCKFAEHKNAIYEMLKMFDEFKDMEDYEFYSITNHPSKADKDLLARMDELVMNDFKLVGNMYGNNRSYIR